MDSPWQIQLLGDLRPARDGQEITRFRTEKTGLLLAYLAFYRDRTHRREALSDLLWPDAEPEAARHNLRMALYSLRRQLEPPDVPPGSVVVADRAVVRLANPVVVTDVAEFEAALQAARRSTSSLERAQWLVDAVALYRGPLLPAGYEEWILAERGRLAARYGEALRQLVAYFEQTGEVDRALEYARRATAAEPLDEDARRGLISLYAAAGRPAAALHEYREFERLLREEMEAAPGPALRALSQKLTLQAAGSGTALPSPRQRSGETAEGGVAALPEAGTVTFLLFQRDDPRPTARGAADPPSSTSDDEDRSLLRQVCAEHGGRLIEGAALPWMAVFARTSDALAGALILLRRWNVEAAISGRLPCLALDTGEVERPEGSCVGPARERAVRLLLAAHGGQVLCSEATAVLIRREAIPAVAPPARLTDLGVYRLRGVDQPERLFQVDASDCPSPSFPAPIAEPLLSTHVPAPLSRFFGREEEIADLVAMLSRADPPTRLLTLTGTAGVGKTRLALEVARRLPGPIGEAIWFVPLADTADPALIPDAVARALRLPRAPQRSAYERVVEALSQRPPGAPGLLILDNFEHLVAGGSAAVLALVQQFAHLTCLVTSRCPLSLPGERLFAVAPLPVPAAAAPPADLTRYPGVRLFVDRGQAVRPDFQVTRGNAAAVAALCQRLEGLPLALELAAARLQVLTPAQLAASLSSLDLLVGQPPGGETRHHSLRTAIQWSYDLLSPALQRCFTRLAVFPGGWTADGAGAVAAPETPILEALGQLAAQQLIRAEEAAASPSTWSGMRFRMLEPLREFAWEQLRAGGALEAARRQHAEYYLEIVEQAVPLLSGPEPAAGLAWLDAEVENLRGALGWASESDAELGLRLAAGLDSYWEYQGHRNEGRAWLERCLASSAAASPAVRARALVVASRFWWLEADYERAQARAEESVALCRALEDGQGIAEGLHRLAAVASYQGEFERAIAWAEEGLAIRRALADRPGAARILHNLAFAALRRGDPAGAQAFCEESIALYRELGDSIGICAAFNNLGDLALYRGDAATARRFYEAGFPVARQLGTKAGIAIRLLDLGEVAYHEGDTVQARSLLEDARMLWQEMGDRRHIALALAGLGRVACAEGEPERARAFLEEALAAHRHAGEQREIALALHGLGEVATMLGDDERAGCCYREALAIARRCGLSPLIPPNLEGLAAVAAKEGHERRAVELFAAAAALRAALEHPVAPIHHESMEAHVAALRESLGGPAFDSAWSTGTRTWGLGA